MNNICLSGAITLVNMNFPIHWIFLCISFLTGLTVYFQKGAPLYLKLFPPFLLVTGVVEVIARILDIRHVSNILLFNFFSIVDFCFLLYVMREIIKNKKVKKLILNFFWAYPLLAILNILFVQKNNFHSITYSLGCLLLVGVSIFYFFELFKFPKSTTLVRESNFWIATAILFFYSCSFPLFGLVNFLSSIPSVIVRSVGVILVLLNILLYSLFTIAFLCRLRFTKPVA